jgi:hypothetical protein
MEYFNNTIFNNDNFKSFIYKDSYKIKCIPKYLDIRYKYYLISIYEILTTIFNDIKFYIPDNEKNSIQNEIIIYTNYSFYIKIEFSYSSKNNDYTFTSYTCNYTIIFYNSTYNDVNFNYIITSRLLRSNSHIKYNIDTFTHGDKQKITSIINSKIKNISKLEIHPIIYIQYLSNKNHINVNQFFISYHNQIINNYNQIYFFGDNYLPTFENDPIYEPESSEPESLSDHNINENLDSDGSYEPSEYSNESYEPEIKSNNFIPNEQNNENTLKEKDEFDTNYIEERQNVDVNEFNVSLEENKTKFNISNIKKILSLLFSIMFAISATLLIIMIKLYIIFYYYI